MGRMKKVYLATFLAAVLSVSAWWILEPAPRPTLAAPIDGLVMPEFWRDPAAGVQRMVSLEDDARRELFTPGGRLEFSPVEGVNLGIKVDRVTQSPVGGKLSHGVVEDEPGGVAVFSDVEGALAGSVELADGRFFTLNYLAPGLHRAAEVDFSTGLLDCGSNREVVPAKLPRGYEMVFDGAAGMNTAQLRADLRLALSRRALRGMPLNMGMRPDKISTRKTPVVVDTGKNKNGLQAQKKKPGSSGRALTKTKATTQGRTGTNSKKPAPTNTAQKKPAKPTSITKKPANKNNGTKHTLNTSTKPGGGKTSRTNVVSQPTTTSTGGVARVDLMVVYTQAALSRFGNDKGIKARVNVAVSRSNQAFKDSGIKAELNLVHVGKVNYQSGGDKGLDLRRLTFGGSGTALKDEVGKLRARHQADIVTLVTSSGGGGVGWLFGGNSPKPQLGFNVVGAMSLYYTVLAHECGHNMGCHHAVGDPGTSKIKHGAGDNFGWRFYANNGKGNRQYRTIMAYAPGHRIGYFSNPDVKFGGVPTGIVNQANNARILNLNARIIARNSDYLSTK